MAVQSGSLKLRRLIHRCRQSAPCAWIGDQRSVAPPAAVVQAVAAVVRAEAEVAGAGAAEAEVGAGVAAAEASRRKLMRRSPSAAMSVR